MRVWAKHATEKSWAQINEWSVNSNHNHNSNKIAPIEYVTKSSNQFRTRYILSAHINCVVEATDIEDGAERLKAACGAFNVQIKMFTCRHIDIRTSSDIPLLLKLANVIMLLNNLITLNGVLLLRCQAINIQMYKYHDMRDTSSVDKRRAFSHW